MYISNYCNYYFISIHAPAKGATRHTHASILLAAFQSTLPRRERHFLSRSRCASSRISIHAPAKGATISLPPRNPYIIFQSTLPRRERHAIHGLENAFIQFQSTLPRRERHHPRLPSCPNEHFNPRSREGSDRHPIFIVVIQHRISIHAPAKGATLLPRISASPAEFQSTLPRRERPRFFRMCKRAQMISIHAPAKGATTLLTLMMILMLISIHAPAKGATQSRRIYLCRQRISIHAPAKGATLYPGGICVE